MVLDEHLSLLLPELKWHKGMHQKSQQSWEGQVYLAHLLPAWAWVSQDCCCCELQMVGVTGSAEECHSQGSLQDVGDILEIPFLSVLFLLKAVGFCHNKASQHQGSSQFLSHRAATLSYLVWWHIWACNSSIPSTGLEILFQVMCPPEIR